MLHIHCLGRLHLQLDGRPFPFRALPKVYPLLAYLLLNRREPIARDRLAFSLWPDVGEEEAKTNLRRHLLHLRRALPESPVAPWLLISHQTIQWNPLAAYWLDVAAFEELSRQPERLDEAADLYVGPLLPQVDEEWLWFERERLHGLYLDLLRRLIEQHRQRGAPAQALPYVRRGLSDDPLREDFVRWQMTLEAALGDHAGALQTYARFTQMLQAEMGVAPMAETRALAERIRRHAPLDPAPAPLPEPAPPLTPGANVPAPLRQLIGRNDTLTALLDFLRAPLPPARLVTLFGPGGVGKTRLALEVAHQLALQPGEALRDGVYFVPLASVAEPALVLPTIAAALGLNLERQTAPLERVIEQLRYKRLLLVLDNFEHLLPAAVTLSALLQAAPGLRLLVTSQAALNVYGEQGFEVPPLALPDARHWPSLEALSRVPAVALFCESARAANSRFQLEAGNAAAVAELVARLDGLPLALELAAARCRLFPPDELLRQLGQALDGWRSRAGDMPARHQTLRAAVEWSYRLLAEEEQWLFTRLALLPGGFTAQSAAAVFDYASEAQALEALERLLDKNMIRPNLPARRPPRFNMLAVLRAYADEWLADDAERAALCLRRLRYFADWTVQFYQGLRGPQQAELLAYLDIEENNLRATLAWALAETAPPEAASLAAQIISDALFEYWTRRGRLGEALAWLERALARHSHLTSAQLFRLHAQAGWFALLQGAYAQAERYYSEGLRLAYQIEDSLLIAQALQSKGLLAGHQGAYAQAELLFSQALALEREANPGAPGMNALIASNNLAITLKHRGDYGRAAALLAEIIAQRRAQGDQLRLASSLSELGQVSLLQGQVAAAARCLAESLRLRRDLGDWLGVLVVVDGVISLLRGQAQLAPAARLCAASLALGQRLGHVMPADKRREFEAQVADLRRRLDEATFAAAWSVGEQWPLTQIIEYALTALQPWLASDPL